MEQNQTEDDDNLDAREASSFSKHWGWFGTIINMAQEDITKVEEITKYPLIFALNYMAYMKDLNELRDKEQRKQLAKLNR